MTKPHPVALDLQFRRGLRELIPVGQQLGELFTLAEHLAPWSPLLRHWILASTKSKAEALLYEAFDAHGPTAAAISVETERNRGTVDVRSIGVWNGVDDPFGSASMMSRNNVLGRPDAVSFRWKLRPEIGDWRRPASLLEHAAQLWPALFATFQPFHYSDKAVFPDRPGVGWMLYLPIPLTARQVPEARALVAVTDKNKPKAQRGTIIVSVIDEPFSDENPEHVKVANAIEIRLVDQDLLPRFADL